MKMSAKIIADSDKKTMMGGTEGSVCNIHSSSVTVFLLIKHCYGTIN